LVVNWIHFFSNDNTLKMDIVQQKGYMMMMTMTMMMTKMMKMMKYSIRYGYHNFYYTLLLILPLLYY